MRNEKIIKILVLSFIIMSLLGVLYSLGFFTDFLPIRSAYKEMYDEFQVFNRAVFNYSLIALIPVILMTVFDNHKTNQYGITNKLIAFIAGGFALYQSYFVLTQIGGLKEQYVEIDPTFVQMLYPNYEMSTMAFDSGYIVYSLLAFTSILVILVALVNKKQKEEIREG